MKGKKHIKQSIKSLHGFLWIMGIFLVLMPGMKSCQFPYVADVDEKSGLISIDGSLVKGDSVQTVIVTRSSSLYSPQFDPVYACVVYVEDELGTVFTFQETGNGSYRLAIADELLVYNRDYKLVVITPDEKRYESAYETILPGAPVDSVYYEREQMYLASQDDAIDGIQFYLDLKGSESDSRYYRWNMKETWEYRSISGITFYYTQEDTIYLSNPYEFYYCWTSKKIPGLYSSSTVNLTSNLKKKIPLHYVSNKTSRLSVKYSLLVEQYSLNEGAYSFWNQTKMETEETGGLYTQQPGQTQSNLYNANDSYEEVLGYFWASSKSTKRIFIMPPHNLPIYPPPCKMELYDPNLYEFGPFPIYIYTDISQAVYTSAQACMNCTLAGGKNKRPSFWE